MTQLEYDIQELQKKQKSDGLTPKEKAELERLQDEWEKIESAKYGQCLSCFL